MQINNSNSFTINKTYIHITTNLKHKTNTTIKTRHNNNMKTYSLSNRIQSILGIKTTQQQDNTSVTFKFNNYILIKKIHS